MDASRHEVARRLATPSGMLVRRCSGALLGDPKENAVKDEGDFESVGATVRCSTELSYAHRKVGRDLTKKGYTKEYKAWWGLRDRCQNPKSQCFASYGGRGIKVCYRWAASYEAFLADMGRAPGRDYSIDRIDNDGDYEPANCRWATRSQQQRNKRPSVYRKPQSRFTHDTAVSAGRKGGISRAATAPRINGRFARRSP